MAGRGSTISYTGSYSSQPVSNVCMYVYTIKTAPIPPCPAPAPPEGKVLLLLLLLLLFCSSPINGGTSNCIYKKYISILLLYIYYHDVMMCEGDVM